MKIVTIENVQEGAFLYISTNEGFREYFYNDSLGNKTIGYGFNADVYTDLTEPISKSEADNLLRRIILKERSFYLPEIYNYDVGVDYVQIISNLPKNIEIVLLDLCYNLGIEQLKQFFVFNNYIRDKKFSSAALDLEHTLWFEEVGIRGKRAVFNLFNPSEDKLYI